MALEDIAIGLLLAVPPIILWSIPSARRRNGSWMVAGKSVAPGCLVIAFLPTLLVAALYHFSGGRWQGVRLNLPIYAIGIGVGIWLIYLLAQYCWRKSPPERKLSWLPFAVLFVFFAGAGLVLTAGITLAKAAWALSQPGGYLGNWKSFPLGGENGLEVVFEQRPIHPFLAEYHYRIRISGNGRTVERFLLTNCGGRTNFNIYRLRDNRLYLVDKDGRYVVDPAAFEVLLLFKSGDRFFGAPLGDSPVTSWGHRDTSEKTTFHLNDRTVTAIPLGDALEGKTYLGSLSNDFYPAAEKAEEPIEAFGRAD